MDLLPKVRLSIFNLIKGAILSWLIWDTTNKKMSETTTTTTNAFESLSPIILSKRASHSLTYLMFQRRSGVSKIFKAFWIEQNIIANVSPILS
jgi:hypothetical protein